MLRPRAVVQAYRYPHQYADAAHGHDDTVATNFIIKTDNDKTVAKTSNDITETPGPQVPSGLNQEIPQFDSQFNQSHDIIMSDFNSISASAIERNNCK